ncbi:hypothetical protein GG344DRAFT_70398 [Lentinula edodes]|nr:hypothetical protein GG344DRAFT_70398 [Lentinula edodes]
MYIPKLSWIHNVPEASSDPAVLASQWKSVVELGVKVVVQTRITLSAEEVVEEDTSDQQLEQIPNIDTDSTDDQMEIDEVAGVLDPESKAKVTTIHRGSSAEPSNTSAKESYQRLLRARCPALLSGFTRSRWLGEYQRRETAANESKPIQAIKRTYKDSDNDQEHAGQRLQQQIPTDAKTEINMTNPKSKSKTKRASKSNLDLSVVVNATEFSTSLLSTCIPPTNEDAPKPLKRK